MDCGIYGWKKNGEWTFETVRNSRESLMAYMRKRGVSRVWRMKLDGSNPSRLKISKKVVVTLKSPIPPEIEMYQLLSSN